MLNTLKFIYPHWKAHKWRMIAIVGLGLVSAALNTVPPLIVKNVIDGLKTNFSSAFLVNNILIIMGTGVSIYIITFFAHRNRAWMNMRIEWEVRARVFSHILKMDKSFFHRFTAGDIVARLLDDIQEKLSWFACSGVFRCVQASITFLTVLCVMLYQNVPLTFWAMIPMPFILLLYVKVGRRLDKRYDAIQKTISEIFSFLEVCFTGIRVVKANRKEKCQIEAFTKRALDQRETEIAAMKMNGIFSTFFQYVGYLCILFVFIGGGKMVIEGRISLGQLVAFQMYTSMVVWPLMDISNFIVTGKRAGVSVQRLEELLKIRAGVTDPAAPCAMPEKITRLELVEVSFRPSEKSPEIIKEVSFGINAGKRVAVVGKIGSGKSILLSLVPRLMDAGSGSILANGTDIRKLKVDLLREKVGYVPQEAVIFSDTLRNNITLGRKIREEDFEKAVEISQLVKEIPHFQKGFDTTVGTRGVTLSGGQKQRIAVARAIAGRPDILLLDDCTSAMDAETEEQLWESLVSAMPGIICLVITHRAKTIETSDWIMTLDNGRLAESGTHAELLKLGGLYKQIYQRERLAEELVLPPQITHKITWTQSEKL